MNDVNEQTELLIVRYLDGRLDASQVREVEALLLRDPGARQLLDDYARIDADARDVLQAMLQPPARNLPNTPIRTAVAARPRRGLWLATAAGVMAAAAVIGVFVFPAGVKTFEMQPAAPQAIARNHSNVSVPTEMVSNRPKSPDEALPASVAWKRMMPHQKVVQTQQKWVAVFDPQTQQIYLVQVNQRDSASVPVLYEH